jgi:hypothetical protein
VLRVPGTYNRKRDPAKPVILEGLGRDYDFAVDLKHVAAARLVTATGTSNVLPFDMSAFDGRGMAAAFVAAKLDPKGDNLGAGINSHSDAPLKPGAIFKECPHFQDAALHHGIGHDQGLWMLTTLACTFFEEGRRWAHDVSNDYPTYSRAETDAMYDRKVRERQERGLGWPSCAAFEGAGCKLCATCVHRGKIKSPLNLALPSNQPCRNSADREEERSNPVVEIMALHQRSADTNTLLAALNKHYAVVRYGGEVQVASVIGQDIFFMKPQELHKMYGNVRVMAGPNLVEVTRVWWRWSRRRQYLLRGIVFEPGGPLEIADDMLNLWRGFGIKEKQGDWSLLRNHILNVVCSGDQNHYDYLMKWMAYAVQRPNEPIGVAIALKGPQGAGKGVVARTLGKIFGKHFGHIANGEQLTGRFNASLATSCAVFLDEALWAGDKKGEGVLKALITEPRLQLEAKFRDPIMVDNRLRIIVASNNDWCVPVGMGDRRWFVLDVANTFAGTSHQDYWVPLYAEIENGGAAAMFHDLLAMDLSKFDVRAVPHTAAKAEQQAHSLHGTEAWLLHILQEGEIGSQRWRDGGLTVSKDQAYLCYEDFSKRQHVWRSEIKAEWSKKIRTVLGRCVVDTRPGKDRTRSFQFASLSDCRRQFEAYAGAQDIEWQPMDEPENPADGVRSSGVAPLQSALNQAATDVALVRRVG